MYILTYLINPFLGLIHSFLSISNKRNQSQKTFYIYLFLCALFVSLVNIYKVPENDLVWYLSSYQYAYGRSFVDFLPGSGAIWGMPTTDYGYDLYVWILSNLFSGNGYIFKFINSLICYLLLGISIIKIGKYYNFTNACILSGISFMVFTPYIFTMSLQIVRQFLASCMFIYLIANLVTSNGFKTFIKRNWWILILMFSFHKSSLFIIVLLLVPFLDKSIKRHKIEYVSLMILIIGYQLVAKFFSGFLPDDSSLGGALDRASSNTTFDLGQMLITKAILIIFIALWAYIVGYKSQFQKKYYGIKQACNIVIILVGFILVNLNQSELSNRFYFYVLPFFPLVCMVLIHKFKISNWLQLLVLVGVLVSWGFYVYNGVWEYDIPGNLLITPIEFYL